MPGEFVGALLLSLVPGVAAGVITAFVSVQLALRRFRAEQWWARKAQAYADLFSALFHVQRYSRQSLERLEEGRQFTDEYTKELAANSSAGYAEIRKAAAIGAFLVSTETAERLERLEKALDDPHYNDDLHEEFSTVLVAVTAAIVDLRALAKRDLNTR